MHSKICSLTTWNRQPNVIFFFLKKSGASENIIVAGEQLVEKKRNQILFLGYLIIFCLQIYIVAKLCIELDFKV